MYQDEGSFIPINTAHQMHMLQVAPKCDYCVHTCPNEHTKEENEQEFD